MRLVLASQSAARAAMLTASGLAFDTARPAVDEESLKAKLLADGAGAAKVAAMLAAAKAMEVSAREPGLVIGADQTLEIDGELVSKSPDLAALRQTLLMLRGRPHRLHSAVVLAQGGAPVWRTADTADLSMRVFSEAFLDGYLERNGERVLSSVGGYQIEGEGLQLFDAVRGDHFTILGMPLLPLLEELRQRGAAAT